MTFSRHSQLVQPASAKTDSFSMSSALRRLHFLEHIRIANEKGQKNWAAGLKKLYLLEFPADLAPAPTISAQPELSTDNPI